MKKLFTTLLGFLIPMGILCSQEFDSRIEQLEKEFIKEDFRTREIPHPGDWKFEMERSGSDLKSGLADVGGAPEWNWVRAFTGSAGADINDIVVDASNNVYALGTFSDSMEIGGTILVSEGLRDVFVAKISSLGQLSWITTLKAATDQNLSGIHIALSNAGVVIVGYLDSDMISGGAHSLTRTGDEIIFMSGISPAGVIDWIQIYNAAYPRKILCDPDGYILYLTDNFSLFKYDADGNYISETAVDGRITDFTLHDTSIWISGGILHTGVLIGDSIFTWEYELGAYFFAQLNRSGEIGYVEFLASPQFSSSSDVWIEADGSGNLYLASEGAGDTFFGDSLLTGWPSWGFVARYDANMDLSWVMGSEDISGNTRIYDVIVVDDNHIYLYGSFYDSIQFGDLKVFPGYERGYFLAELNASGEAQNIYDYEIPLYKYELGPGNALYYASYDQYDHWLHKKTVTGIEFWTVQVWNNGGDASIWYTMDIDEDGNLYAQGFYRGTVKLPGTTTKGRGIFFMKFTNQGNVEWLKTMENPSGSPSGIKVDDEGNVYAWGGFSDYIKIEGEERYNGETAGEDIYFIKFDRDGELKALHQYDGKGYMVGIGGINMTPENDVLICGIFSDTLVLEDYRLIANSPSFYDMFIAKINPKGNIIWARQYGGKYHDWARSVAADSLGNIYFTGAFRDSIAFNDSITFTHYQGAYDFFLGKLDRNGNLLWIKRGGEENYYARGHSMVIHEGRIYVQGLAYTYLDILPTVTIGGKVLISEFEANSFLASFNLDGEGNWLRLFKINDYSWPMYKIDTDPEGNVYAGGIFMDTIIVENHLIEGFGGRDYYVVKYSPEGDFQWMKTSESANTGQVSLYSLAAFEEDIVLVGGNVSGGSVTIGGETIRSGSNASFAGLIGDDIVGCFMHLSVETVDEDFGLENGTAELSISGGTAPYLISWTTGEVGTETFIDSLAAGSYQVTVVDDKGCEQFALFSINHNGPVIALNQLGDVSCNGAGDGFIDIDVSGGTGPYSYSWDNGYTTQDLTNLTAAPYTVTVVDANGLMVSEEFTIKEPKPLDISFTITEASCGGASDGSIEVFTSGGTKPYDWEWNTGVFTQSLIGESAGKYTLKVLDANNCIFETEIPLSEENAPIVETEYMEPSDCGVANGAARVRVLESAGEPIYLWSDAAGTTEPEIVGQRARTYFVTVTDTTGCKSIHLVDIEEKKPADNQICLVTVDTTTVNGANLVVWEKDTFAIEYRVYRETSAKDVYLLAGAVAGSDLSVFTDSVANPTIRSYRYQIAAVDECGNESYLSHLHKTVHLTISPGLSDNIINLRWDDYIGESFESFEIWRYTSLYGWEMLEEQPSTLKSYTDIEVPPGKVFYNVRVPMPNPCEPEGNGTKAGTGPYYHSLSNMDDNKLQETGVKSHMADMFYVYPNPGRGKVTVWSENFQIEKGEILVSDLAGRTVWHDKFEHNLSGRLELDLSGQASGTYIVQLRMDGQVYFQKLIKQ